MAERPPPGYDKRDKPLPHDFVYRVPLIASSQFGNKFMATFIRTSTDTGDPKTIEVNPRNTSFAVDKGPCICFDSIVQFMTISTDIILTESFVYTEKLSALAIYHYNIHGSFEDSWTPADEKTTTTIAQLLHITSDTTKEDVVPETAGADLGTFQNHPLSTVTMAEAFGDYDLGTNLIPENTTDDQASIDELRDALQYYTNGGKLKTLMGKINRTILTNNRLSTHTFEKRFTPRSARFGNPHTFFGRQYIVPPFNDVDNIFPVDATLSGASVCGVNIRVRYNEWNPDFDQARM